MLAGELGWQPSQTNYAYQLTAARAGEWDVDATLGLVRPLTAGDLDAIRPLHEAEFPATYLPLERMLPEAGNDRRVAVVIERDGAAAGYATGTVTPDGDGYIDFVAVRKDMRSAGAGRTLVAALSRQLLQGSTTGRINLTVQEQREPARALYARLGFTVDDAFRGYRSAGA